MARDAAEERRQAVAFNRSQSSAKVKKSTALSESVIQLSVADIEAVDVMPSSAGDPMVPDVDTTSSIRRTPSTCLRLASTVVDIASSLPFTPITLVFRDIRQAYQSFSSLCLLA